LGADGPVGLDEGRIDQDAEYQDHDDDRHCVGKSSRSWSVLSRTPIDGPANGYQQK
jgi:hypothetical protein